MNSERMAAVFPRDTLKIMGAAFKGATDIIVGTFPDHRKTNEGIHVVAEANYAEFSRLFWTDDPQRLKLLFLESFMSGYDSVAQYFEYKPESHQQFVALPEDARLYAFQVMFDGWYEVTGKTIKRCVERANKKTQRKR